MNLIHRAVAEAISFQSLLCSIYVSVEWTLKHFDRLANEQSPGDRRLFFLLFVGPVQRILLGDVARSLTLKGSIWSFYQIGEYLVFLAGTSEVYHLDGFALGTCGIRKIGKQGIKMVVSTLPSTADAMSGDDMGSDMSLESGIEGSIKRCEALLSMFPLTLGKSFNPGGTPLTF